ncbi:ABC transporter ATP-binding protein [Arthrospiribacter ruber]|uniref:ABC transporter ATP-binding protein n=1 Tax=Arthrospiribacter ruber TaxID=2487934 RepID=A0A951MA23_9BACT|nr:ABC transporter ATP-binding protein [Arthrospiribacter ruber]MBW3466344.1 ABC transporter ATP-binding protein [Arthrospiribacter ruber]
MKKRESGRLVYFKYFYSKLGYKVFIALFLSLCVGLLDGFGLAMFLPLLQMVGDTDTVSSGEELGGLQFLISGLESLGVQLNLQTVLFVIMFFFIFKGVTKFCQGYYNVLTQQYFIRKLRLTYAKMLGNYSYKSFVNVDSGMVQNTMGGEMGRVSTAFKNYFSTIQSGVLVAVYLGLAIATNFQFAILVAIGGTLSNLVYNRIYKKTKLTSKKITKGGHIYQGLLIQNVAFYKYLRATGLMSLFYDKMKVAIEYIERSNKKIGFYNSLVVAAREPLVITVVVIVILIQVNLFSENISAIVLSLLFFYRSLNSLVELQNHWNNFLNVTGSLDNVIEFGQQLAKAQDKKGNEEFLGLNNSIKLEDVSFGYFEDKVLQKINLDIQAKSTVAFVGESGSGKTTLVNLIAGLFDADTGKILIDDKDLCKIDKLSFQKKIGYITQEPVIFSDTIFNNITAWSEKSPENQEKFWKALKKAAIDDFVKELPEREDSKLGNNGIQVSGGQKQRLAIARELYKETEILVMDEATSALDSETEKIIQKNIDQLKGQLTILIIAHRLSTIRTADKIILLKNGNIEAVGSYSELIVESEKFKKMVQLQEV